MSLIQNLSSVDPGRPFLFRDLTLPDLLDIIGTIGANGTLPDIGNILEILAFLEAWSMIFGNIIGTT